MAASVAAFSALLELLEPSKLLSEGCTAELELPCAGTPGVLGVEGKTTGLSSGISKVGGIGKPVEGVGLPSGRASSGTRPSTRVEGGTLPLVGGITTELVCASAWPRKPTQQTPVQTNCLNHFMFIPLQLIVAKHCPAQHLHINSIRIKHGKSPLNFCHAFNVLHRQKWFCF